MKYKTQLIIILFIIILAAVPIVSMASPDRLLSEVERRPLSQLTGYSQYLDTYYGAGLSDYLAYLENYLLDQFPLRDELRSLNAAGRVYGLRLMDYKLYYKLEGHLAKLDPTLRPNAVEGALAHFNRMNRDLFDGQGKQLFALIPDKNVFMAEKEGYPHYPYAEMLDLIENNLDEEIHLLSLLDHLSLDHYYRTDPHWNQTKLEPVSSYILEALGLSDCGSESYQVSEGLTDYFGTYAGQAALPVEADRLSWLSSQSLNNLTLYDPVTGERTGIYQKDKLEGADPYDLFMGGAKPLLIIGNEAREEGRQLVVFRDSFGSSLIPLLADAYREVIVIDLRYISMGAVSGLADIDPGADVLHLYSMSVLNSPGAFLT